MFLIICLEKYEIMIKNLKLPRKHLVIPHEMWVYTNKRGEKMKEFVGTCKDCEKEIYCLDGFINGVVLEDKKGILCFDCAEENQDD